MNIALATRLTTAGGKDAHIRLALMAFGVALGVAMLVAASTALPLIEARENRVTGRSAQFANDELTTGIQTAITTTLWRGKQLHEIEVAQIGDVKSPPPQGVPRIPTQGEVYVSPALKQALAGSNGEGLRPRVEGNVVGVISDEALLGPDELYAISGVAPVSVEERPLSPGFTNEPAKVSGPTPADEMLRDELENDNSTAVLIAATGLLIPIMVFVANSTRLSNAARERRASAIRLVGASANDIRILSGVEGAIVGALGAVAGLGLFYALRRVVAPFLPSTDGAFAHDLQPPAATVWLILVATPILCGVAGAVALRHAASNPLTARKSVVRQPSGITRITPFALGLALLVGAYLRHDGQNVDKLAAYLVIGGCGLCLLGLATSASTITRLAGTALAKWGRSTATEFAGKRLLSDPTSAARSITGTTLVVLIACWAVAFIPMLSQNAPIGNGKLIEDLKPRTVIASFRDEPRAREAAEQLREVNGVEAVVEVTQVSLRPQIAVSKETIGEEGPSPIEDSRSAVIIDCAQLSKVARVPLEGCNPSEVQRMTGRHESTAPTGRFTLRDPYRDRTSSRSIDVPDHPTTVRIPDGIRDGFGNFGLNGTLIIPPSLVGETDLPITSLLIGTDGAASTVEHVRNRLPT